MNRRGFAWYELVFVLVCVASISSIAVPKFDDLKRQSEAAKVIADIDTVKNAVFRFYSDSGYFPQSIAFAVVPESLAPYLPPGFSFRRSYGSLDYKNWPVSAPYGETVMTNIIGVAVAATDARVGAAALTQFGESPKLAVGNNRVFLIFGG